MAERAEPDEQHETPIIVLTLYFDRTDTGTLSTTLADQLTTDLLRFYPILLPREDARARATREYPGDNILASCNPRPASHLLYGSGAKG